MINESVENFLVNLEIQTGKILQKQQFSFIHKNIIFIGICESEKNMTVG